MITREFFIPCIPPKSTAQQGVRAGIVGGKARIFKSAKSRQIAQNWVALLNPHAPPEPINMPVKLTIEVTFPHNKSARKSERESMRVPHDRKPDTDNLTKAIKDAMTFCGFWIDDAQVFDEHIRKFRGQQPGLNVSITY